jgi:hypothetical protein
MWSGVPGSRLVEVESLFSLLADASTAAAEEAFLLSNSCERKAEGEWSYFLKMFLRKMYT